MIYRKDTQAEGLALSVECAVCPDEIYAGTDGYDWERERGDHIFCHTDCLKDAVIDYMRIELTTGEIADLRITATKTTGSEYLEKHGPRRKGAA